MLIISALFSGLLDAPALAKPASTGASEFYDQTVQDAWNVDYVGHVGGAVHAVTIQGEYAYIGEDTQLTIVDISDPANPSIAGRCIPFYDRINDIAIAAGYAYVADFYYGLRIVDVSDPANPFEVGFYDTQGNAALGIAVSGSYAYVAVGNAWRVVDVSVPDNPVEAGFYDAYGQHKNVSVSGGLVYLAAGYGYLYILHPTGLQVNFTFMPMIVSP